VSDATLAVTVLVQTKNEERAITACLERLVGFDEVIVVDSQSADRTAELARAKGAAVVEFMWNGRYPKKKQWQLDNLEVRNEWILFLDADEWIDDELKRSIASVVQAPGGAGAGQLRLAYHFAGRRLRHGHSVQKTVLIRRGAAQFRPVDDLDIPGMGELEGHYQPVVSGHVAQLDGFLHHDDPDPVATWFERHNRYSDWEAGLRWKRAHGAAAPIHRSAQGRLFDRVPFKPAAFFAYSYVIRAGFLDGRAGFDYAMALAMYYWQIGVKYRELVRNEGHGE
jgi:glycosyltransferase involved in cell wall biosynthesis